jgi:hypothetical protein
MVIIIHHIKLLASSPLFGLWLSAPHTWPYVEGSLGPEDLAPDLAQKKSRLIPGNNVFSANPSPLFPFHLQKLSGPGLINVAPNSIQLI